MFQTISRNTQGGTAHHIFDLLSRQLESAEEPFSEYEKNFEKPVYFRRRKVRNRDNTNLWTTLIRLLSETMIRSLPHRRQLPTINNLLSVLKKDIMSTIHQNFNKQETI